MASRVGARMTNARTVGIISCICYFYVRAAVCMIYSIAESLANPSPRTDLGRKSHNMNES